MHMFLFTIHATRSTYGVYAVLYILGGTVCTWVWVEVGFSFFLVGFTCSLINIILSYSFGYFYFRVRFLSNLLFLCTVCLPLCRAMTNIWCVLQDVCNARQVITRYTADVRSRSCRSHTSVVDISSGDEDHGPSWRKGTRILIYSWHTELVVPLEDFRYTWNRKVEIHSIRPRECVGSRDKITAFCFFLCCLGLFSRGDVVAKETGERKRRKRAFRSDSQRWDRVIKTKTWCRWPLQIRVH